MTEINEVFISFPHQESQFYHTEPCFGGEFPRHIPSKKRGDIPDFLEEQKMNVQYTDMYTSKERGDIADRLQLKS